MTVRQLAGAWLAALVMAAGAVGAVRSVAPPRHEFFQHVQVAVIGSSLMKSAVAPTGSGATSLLGDGRIHERVGVNSVEEWQAITLAAGAVSSGARVVLIEVNPFIRDLPAIAAERTCDARQTGLRHWLKDTQFTLANDFHSAFGLSRMERRGDGDPPRLHEQQHFTADEIKVMYPLVLHQPYCGRELGRLVQATRAHGVTMVMLLPPHSAASEVVQGKRATAALRALASQTAAGYGLPLFAPQGPWDNAEFYDLAHLNVRGRAHFQAELAAWWRSR
ncbi:MAG: hypothetical protein ABI673_06275 [Novosphingobium sp.]